MHPLIISAALSLASLLLTAQLWPVMLLSPIAVFFAANHLNRARLKHGRLHFVSSCFALFFSVLVLSFQVTFLSKASPENAVSVSAAKGY
jgi:hypothetical protein